MPFSGVVSVHVSSGDRLSCGQTVATIEAMKMEAAITSPIAGVIERETMPKVTKAEDGSLIAVVGEL